MRACQSRGMYSAPKGFSLGIVSKFAYYEYMKANELAETRKARMHGGRRNQALGDLLSGPPHDRSSPHPGKEIKTGTYYSILKDLGIKER